MVLESARLELANSQSLPDLKCHDKVVLAKYVLQTEQMGASTEARLLEAQAKALKIAAMAAGNRLAPADFASGSQMTRAAEMLIRAELIRTRGGTETDKTEKAARALIAYETAFENCETLEYVTAENEGEISRNRFLVRHINAEAANLKALLAVVNFKPLLEARYTFDSLVESIRAKDQEAVEARSKDRELRRQAASTDLLKSKEEYAAALRAVRAR